MAKSFYKLPEKEIKLAIAGLVSEDVLVESDGGYLLKEDAETLKTYTAPEFHSVYALHRNDPLYKAFEPALKSLAKSLTEGLPYDCDPLQYLLIDGVFHGADEDGMYIISYRDPNVAQTFTVYNYVPMLLQQLQMSLDQETLDGYILSSYSYYALSSGELTGALSVITDVVNGDDPFRRLQWMHELKQLKVEDIMAFAPMYQALLDNGCMSTAGSQSALNTMPAGTYENIIKP